MATIETIPTEILAELLSYLRCQDLLHTARVSHKFHAHSTLLLYKAPCVTSISGVTIRNSWDIRLRLRRTTPPLQIFLRTLLSPGGEELAIQVRSLRVRWDNLPLEPPTYLSHKWVVIFAAAASRLGLNLPLASQSAQVVLLLYLLPRLEVLHLIPPVASEVVFDFIDRHHNAVPGVAPRLPLYQLREFCCFRATIHDLMDPRSLMILLGLPNMRRLDVHIAEPAILLLPAPTHPSAVTRLRLTGDPLSPRAMTCILRATSALTHFSYCVRYTTNDLDITHIGPALAALRGTLQVLHVQVVGAMLSATITGTLGSFRGWPHLRTLRCPMNTLLVTPAQTNRLVDILPEVLRELEIVGDPFWRPEEEVDQVRRLVALKRSAVPALERIGMALWTRGDAVFERVLRGVCDEAGVGLQDESRPSTRAEVWREAFDDV